MVGKGLLLLLLPLTILGQIAELLRGLEKAADFALLYHEDINFDGLLGFVIAEAQILQSLQLNLTGHTRSDLEFLLRKHEGIRRKIVPRLPTTPSKMIVLEKYLLRPESWFSDELFTIGALENLGIYKHWSADDILDNQIAVYKSVPSDHCLKEILVQNCHVGPFCAEMMLAPREDVGYLLSHRLFYLQIARLKGCQYHRPTFRHLTTKFCSLMLKEARTNAHLGFPVHDIVLEQMVLCGIEGYSEFLTWKNNVITWQTLFGCYKNKEEFSLKRSSNTIEFGCSDHSTGLGAAALAVNLRFVLNSVN